MTTSPPSSIDRLLSIMARLRDPDTGCPWDVEQNFASIAPHTIEEAYEVADAIERGNMHDLKEELGDLLLQVVFHGQMAQEQGAFTFDDVASAIADKLINRHPHVFGDARVDTADQQTQAWEALKDQERQAKATAENRQTSALDGVARGFPALMRAQKLQKRAARVGFDWPEPAPVLEKLRDEIRELETEMGPSASTQRLHDELGDVLFSAVNLSRHLDVDPESALRHANEKFLRRFQAVESALLESQGKRPEEMDPVDLERLWEQVKANEKT